MATASEVSVPVEHDALAVPADVTFAPALQTVRSDVLEVENICCMPLMQLNGLNVFVPLAALF